MIHCIAITKARTNLGAIVKRIHRDREWFILERNGVPVAALVDLDTLERLSNRKKTR